jgi:hypothetical protein
LISRKHPPDCSNAVRSANQRDASFVDLYLNQLTAHAAVFNDEFSDAYRELEASRTSAAGIEIEHSVARLLLGNVRVSADDNRESRRFGLQVHLRKIVQHIDRNAAELDHLSLRKQAGPWPLVNVSAHRSHRSNLGKLHQYLWRADIAGMNDVLRSAQSFNGLGPQQTVGVGDDPD